MADSSEALLARIDERTEKLNESIAEVLAHQQDTEKRLRGLEIFRGFALGGFAVLGGLLSYLKGTLFHTH